MSAFSTEAVRANFRSCGYGSWTVREMLLAQGWVPLCLLGRAENFVRGGRRCQLVLGDDAVADPMDFALHHAVICQAFGAETDGFFVEAL